jgi:hypothetical protein
MPTYYSMFNSALAGAMAGMQSQRQATQENSGALVGVADFTTLVTTCTAFATEVDALLLSLQGGVTNVGLLTGMVNDGATVVGANGNLQLATEILPVCIALLCKAAFDGRGIPVDPSGNVFVQADYVPVATSVVNQFFAWLQLVVETNGAVYNPPLLNCAFAGALAGAQSGRQFVSDNAGALPSIADFATVATSALKFGFAVDAALNTLASGGAATQIGLLVSGGLGGSTLKPTSAASANAAESLPITMGIISKAFFDTRPTIVDITADLQGDYATQANSVAAQFIEALDNFVIT